MSNSSNYYSSLLRLCCETRNLTQAKKLHCLIIKSLENPETFLYNNLINAYGKVGNITYARHVFDKIPQPNSFSWNTMLSAYSKSGNLSTMQEIFSTMPNRDGVSWNSLISGYVCFGSVVEAVKAYKLMMKDGVLNLNRITFSTMLLLVSSQGCVDLGRQIHGQIVKFGFGAYVFVGSSLMDMYAKMGLISVASQVFDEVQERNVVMYNTMITGFLRCGMVKDSMRVFHGMKERDSISWTTMITGLLQNGLEAEAMDLFRDMRREGMAMDQSEYNHNVFVGSALVDMYCKCKSVRYAEAVFKRMTNKNVVSWTAMLVGYGQNGFSEEAVRVFCDMQRNGIEPDDFTLGSVISSCANLASLEEGAQFHCQALVSGLISFITVSNALITLYGKCGSIEDSNQLFDEMNFRDEISWTALVSGYAQFGKATETIDLFERMLVQGLKPDAVTFIAVLSACSRAGMVERGQQYFESMLKDHGILPFSDHFTCMIDLFGRAGRLEEAKNFIITMPFSPDSIGWATLLSSCRLYGNEEIGKWAAESLLELDPQNPAGYILLSSIYAAKGKWERCGPTKERNERKESKKGTRIQLDQIYAELEKLNHKMIEAGYVPDSSSVLHDVEDSEKMKMLNHHSEKLAIAFGLLFIPHVQSCVNKIKTQHAPEVNQDQDFLRSGTVMMPALQEYH
ncbi:hypothetical protein OIU84_019284 [Salix udensis]|uniref:DYW domain-containing protein n=1 Tax=Salix udensis TaxID=889485 RepID=A0AAD6PJ85_9ROSI|nr:hypothetical protein OIU84_019284 [Salix udensis]